MKRNFERIALVLTAVLTVSIMLVSLYYERQLSNQKAMFYQLQAIRTSVNLYKALNRVNPQGLKNLTDEEYSFPGEESKRRYYQSPTVNKKGEIIDPFGNPYYYDAISGWVKSTTSGYEYW